MDRRDSQSGGTSDMAGAHKPSHPSPPYSGPLEELEPQRAGSVRVRLACPYCGEILERIARHDETRWYLPSCGIGHSGIGIADPSVERIKAHKP